MSHRLRHGLSKRERQIMKAVYSRKSAIAAEVSDGIPDPKRNRWYKVQWSGN